jgi:CubicO group peptidase (beta-lactamase class C family)
LAGIIHFPRVACVAARAAFAVCLLSLLSACTTLSSTVAEGPVLAGRAPLNQHNLQANVDMLVKPLIDGGVTPAMEVAVLLPDGSAHFYGYGVANKASGAVPQADTQFAVGSLSKGFLALLTAQLVAEGQLAWTDRLDTLLPKGTVLSPDARQITLLQLMTHTSGLPRQPMTLQTLHGLLRYLFTGESFYGHFTASYMLEYLKNFKRPTSVEVSYSNVGYGLVGYILEQRSQQPLEKLMARYVLAPLRLEHSGYDARLLPGYAARAHGYAGDQPKLVRRGQPVPDWDFSGLMKGSASIHSSARDLLTLAAAFVDPPVTGVRGQALRELMRVHQPYPGLNVDILWDQDRLDGVDIHSMIGLVAGYTAYLGVDSVHHSAVVVLQNSFNWTDHVGHRLLTRIARSYPASVAVPVMATR